MDRAENTPLAGRVKQLFVFFFFFRFCLRYPSNGDHRRRWARDTGAVYFSAVYFAVSPGASAIGRDRETGIVIDSSARHRYRRPAMNRHRRHRIRQGCRCPSPLSSCAAALLLLLASSSLAAAATSSRSRRTLPSAAQAGVGPVRLCKPTIYMKTGNGQVPNVNQLNPGQCLRHRGSFGQVRRPAYISSPVTAFGGTFRRRPKRRGTPETRPSRHVKWESG